MSAAVIDLVSSGEDEKPATCRDFNDGEEDSSPAKRVKLSADDTDDDEIEVVEEPSSSMDSAPLSSAASSQEDPTAEDTSNSDEIAVVGTKNQTILPHMRPHCGAHPFQIPTKETLHTPTTGDNNDRNPNLHYCQHCFCFICDTPVTACSKWDLHCNATDQGPCAALCWQLRERYRAERQRRAAQPHCRHCSVPLEGQRQRRPVMMPVCGDWCTQCGRVALESALRNRTTSHSNTSSTVVTPTDVCLGQREIPFHAVTRNPRNMQLYAAAWEANKGKPGWTIDEDAEALEFIEHRLGPHPTLQALLTTIAVAGKESVPSDGVIRSSVSEVSADETEAIVLENENDLMLLRVMNEIGLGGSSRFKGNITQSFDEKSKRGKIRIEVFASASKTLPGAGRETEAIFLAHWFRFYPFSFEEIYLDEPSNPTHRGQLETAAATAAIAASSISEPKPIGSDDQDDAPVHSDTPELTDVALDTSCRSNFFVPLFREIIPSWICNQRSRRGAKVSKNEWRTMRKDAYSRSQFKRFDSKLSMLFDENEENAVLHTKEAALQQHEATQSIPGLLDHLSIQSHSTVAKKVTGLSAELTPAQSQCLEWAIERESMHDGIQMMHWVKLSDDAFFNPVLSKFSKTKPAVVRGGIIGNVPESSLAILALILENGANRCDSSKVDTLAGVASEATLVICDTDRADHWLKQFSSNGVNVFNYDKVGAESPTPEVLAKETIVLVTYETFASVDRPDDPSPFGQVRWWRIVCDDSHLIGKQSRPSVRSLLKLSATNKWLVSGTPIDTTLDDLSYQIRFLGYGNVDATMDVFRGTIYPHVRDPSLGEKSFFVGGYNIGLFTFFFRPLLLQHSSSSK